MLAILLAGATDRSSLTFDVFGLSFSPLRSCLLAAVLVYLHGMLVHRHALFGIAATMCLAAAGFGESPATISRNVATVTNSTYRTMWGLVPRTVVGWGFVSIASAYALLGIGLAISLLRPPPVVRVTKPMGVGSEVSST
jgi:hypothetical protein